MRTIYLIAFSLLLPLSAAAQDRYAVLVGGLGGSAEHTEKFRQYLFETRQAFVDGFGVPAANVTVLAEPAIAEESFVADVSTASTIRAHFGRLAQRMRKDDQLFVILYGHGSFDGTNARLNIPRRDLNDVEYAELVDAIPAARIVFVNTAAASAPFVEALSAPDRIVIAATKSGTQRNETSFPQFFVEALTSADADLDKNGDLSVLEAFRYAAEQTARYYAETQHLATEHPQLDDSGDAEGTRAERLDGSPDGNLAAVTYLRRRGASLAAVSGADRAEAARLLQQRDALERDIAALKSRKINFAEDDYYARLEMLFLRLARLNDRLEGRASGE